MPRSDIARSYGGFIPSFYRNLYTVFHSGYISLHPHQQCKRVAFSPHPLPHLLSVNFWMLVILTAMRWYFIVVLICISLIISDVEHFFMFLLAICMSSLVKCLFISFACFWVGLFVFLVLSCMSCLYVLEINPLSLVSFALFPPILRVIFSPCLKFPLLCKSKVITFNGTSISFHLFIIQGIYHIWSLFLISTLLDETSIHSFRVWPYVIHLSMPMLSC